MADLRNVMTKMLKENANNIKLSTNEQLLFGTVTAIEPKIKIKIQNKYEIEEGNILLISALCKKPLLSRQIDGETVYGLQIGDKVRMLSLNNNQILYCIERG